MNIKLDKSNPIPIGIQVKEQIKMLINSGDYKEGDKLPSINELSNFLGVNKNTVVTVLKDLEHENYIRSQRGKGVFVNVKNKKKEIDPAFVSTVDAVVAEAKSRGMDASELINMISARYSYLHTAKRIKVLFVIGISRELLDANVKKLRDEIQDADFEGLLLDSSLTREKASEALAWADLIVLPAVAYEYIKEYLPQDKPVIKTMINWKLLSSLKKGIEKKSKVAVVGVTGNGSKALANMIVASKLFKPKLVLSLDSIDDYKKDFKDIDSVVVCLSAREALEKPYMKNKNTFVFSDYIDEDSISEIKNLIQKYR